MQMSWSLSKATCQLFVPASFCLKAGWAPRPSIPSCPWPGGGPWVRPVLGNTASMINLSGTSTEAHRGCSIKNRQHQRGMRGQETGRCNTNGTFWANILLNTQKIHLKKKSERQKSYLVCSGFYKAWRMARLLSCVQWRVWSIWDNHLRLLGSNLYGLFVGWKKKYSSSIKETGSAKFIVRQIKILFTLLRRLVKPQLFTSRNDITPAHTNKNPQKGLLHKKEGKKTAFV